MPRTGPRAFTTVEEKVAEDEHAALLKLQSLDVAEDKLRERAIFAARTANLAELEECLDTFGLPFSKMLFSWGRSARL